MALVFCESKLDWAFELDSSSLLNFLVELVTDWGFGGTLSSGIGGKLAVRAMWVYDIRPALNCILTFYENINITFHMSKINQFPTHFQRKYRDSPTVQTPIASWCCSHGVIIGIVNIQTTNTVTQKHGWDFLTDLFTTMIEIARQWGLNMISCFLLVSKCLVARAIIFYNVN